MSIFGWSVGIWAYDVHLCLGHILPVFILKYVSVWILSIKKKC